MIEFYEVYLTKDKISKLTILTDLNSLRKELINLSKYTDKQFNELFGLFDKISIIKKRILK